VRPGVVRDKPCDLRGKDPVILTLDAIGEYEAAKRVGYNSARGLFLVIGVIIGMVVIAVGNYVNGGTHYSLQWDQFAAQHAQVIGWSQDDKQVTVRFDLVPIAGGRAAGDVEPVTVIMTEQAANELGLSIAGVKALTVPRQ